MDTEDLFDQESGELKSPIVYFEGTVTPLNFDKAGDSYFGGPVPQVVGLPNGAVIHNVLCLGTEGSPWCGRIANPLNILFPFRHDGSDLKYSVSDSGEVSD